MSVKVALYPFCEEILPFVRHFDELQDQYSICKLISPPGLGLTGKDAAFVCNHSKIGLTVSDNLSMKDLSWDTLLLVRTLNKIIMDDSEFIYYVEEALQAGKKVSKIDFYKEDTDIPEKEDGFCQIEIPVILVGGLLREADTSEVLIELYLHLKEDGYRPLVFSRHPFGTLCGFHSLSHILNCNDLTESQKIHKINLYVKDLERKELPDIILIEAPDAVMRYNNFAPNGFGIQSYICCQAIQPDYFICCMPCDLAVGRLIDALSLDFTYRLGSPIHIVHVSNLIIDSADILQTHTVTYAHATLDSVRNQISRERKESQVPLYNCLDDSKGMYQELLSLIT